MTWSEVITQPEKALIRTRPQETNGNKTQYAKLLKIGHKTPHRKMREHEIDCNQGNIFACARSVAALLG